MTQKYSSAPLGGSPSLGTTTSAETPFPQNNEGGNNSFLRKVGASVNSKVGLVTAGAFSALFAANCAAYVIEFEQFDYSIDEGGVAMIGVLLSCDNSNELIDWGPVSISYDTSDGTATAGVNYTAANGTLTWGVDDCGLIQTFDVFTNDDSDVEDDETVRLILDKDDPQLAFETELTILDNDSTPLPSTPIVAAPTFVGFDLWNTWITLKWADKSSNETGFKLTRDGTLIATTAADVTEYHDSGLNCDTTYEYSLTATNATGDSTAATTTETTPCLLTFTSTAITDAKEDVTYIYNISTEVKDISTKNITISAETIPTWLTLTDKGNGTATLTGTPDVDGMHEVILQVNDGTDTEHQDFTIYVPPFKQPVNNAPTFTSTPIPSVNEGASYTYNITTNDANGDSLSISAPVKPTWLTMTDSGNGTATLKGTPTVAGTHEVTLRVNDGKVDTDQSFTITVNANVVANTPPTAQMSVSPKTGEAPLTVNLSSSSSDPDGTIINYQWNSSDGQTALGEQTTLTFGAVGTYKISLVVTDNDGLTSNTAPQTVTVAEQLPPVAEFTVTISGAVSETGTTTGTVTVPTSVSSDLIVNLASNDTGEATVPATVTIPQDANTVEFTIAGVNDLEIDGDQTPLITASAEGYTAGSATVTVTDDDVAGITVVPPSIAITEGAAGSYSIKLNTIPTDVVTLSVVPADGQCTVMPASIAFLDNTETLITVTATDDTNIEGNHTCTITHTVITDDTDYTNVSANVSVSITDNERYVKITQSDGSSSVIEAGNTDTFDVVLSAEPTSDVTITVTPDSQITVDKNTLTFNSDNWHTAQTVTMTAVDDEDDEADVHSSTLSISSENDSFQVVEVDGTVATHFSVSITDNDELTTTTPKPPVAQMSVNPKTGTVPLTVNLSSSSYDPDGSIEKCEWQVPGKSSVSDCNTQMTFDRVGTYDITLTVTDNDGLTATATDSVTVSAKPSQPPVEPTPPVLSVSVEFSGLTEIPNQIPKEGLDQTVKLAEKTSITRDIKIANSGSVKNAVIKSKVTGTGWVYAPTYVAPEGSITDCVISGHTTTVAGTLDSIDFRGYIVDGSNEAGEVVGTLAGDIVNNSKIGGYFKDFNLAPGTTITGGELRGTISGDAEKPAVLKNLTIHCDTVLENVIIGEGVEIDPECRDEVLKGNNVQFADGVKAPSEVEDEVAEGVDCSAENSDYEEGLEAGKAESLAACQDAGTTTNCPRVDTPASFSLSEGTLKIPAVDVPEVKGFRPYQLEMKLISGVGEELTFSVTHAEPVQSEDAPDTPRFTDNEDGTVTDNHSGLIWLKNANCFGSGIWDQTKKKADELADGQCGLTDGSTVGDWRLPNVKELQSLISYDYYSPALSNAAGTGQWTEGDAFSGVQMAESYWLSTPDASDITFAWRANLYDGSVDNRDKFGETYYVWPVRGQ